VDRVDDACERRRRVVAVAGVNKIVDRPVYLGDVLVRLQLMNLSSSFDPRVIDSADAAAFVQTIKRHLETPAALFVGADR
jgi:2-oxoisovalerate dehydrogenase E2 component (dihydrolipoyl transacylase)